MRRFQLQWIFLLAIALPAPAAAQVDLGLFKGMQARLIGPAGMSGRIAAIESLASDPDLILIGAASGGVWKSVNGGITWEPIFDDQPVASVGALAIDPSNPDVIWAGTGEGNPRNSVSVGNGVYKSLDGGRSWRHLGLEQSEHIHRVLIHPGDTDTVYVCALGPLWSDGEQRGVFKTGDGGESWERVLYANQRTGCGDLVMDPRNPEKLMAALWEHRRTPAFFTSGGPGSGLHVTFDGGGTWTRRTHEDGLPKGELGRIGLGIARSRPNVAYALVEARKNALYRSDDGGFKWRKVNDSRNVNPRPFYYADLRVDPKNENRIYTLHGTLQVSEDAGKSFETVVPSRIIHGDHHALWIHPDKPEYLIAGNDGGLAISQDQGKTWRFVENLPLAQFYHIAVDNLTPYNVYGGLQDNGSWRGPSRVWVRRGIHNHYWARVGTGDGFDVRPDPSNPDRFGYAMSQGGNLFRFDLLTGERKSLRPVHPRDVHLRFNWDAALAIDPFDPAAIYYGSQFVHRSADRGETWQVISPDLTTDDPDRQKQLDSGGLTYDVTAAENNTTVVDIAPSPLERGLIWTGSDDGKVHVTRDGGRSWQDVTGNIPGLPPGIWVPHVEPSTHQAPTAFAVFDDHRRGDWTTYLYRTDDYGQSWARIATEGVRGYPHIVRQDPVAASLLFLGTEFGLWVSFDAGRNWSQWTHGVPTTSVMDLVIHSREHDLVIGTHGRAVFILDDIRPLRRAAERPALLEEDFHLFAAGEAIQYIEAEPAGIRGPGHAEFQGENEPYGARLAFLVGKSDSEEESRGEADDHAEEEKKGREKATIEILDSEGEVIRTLKADAQAGINRAYWPLRKKGTRPPSREAPRPEAPEPAGREVLPGSYQARVRFGDQEGTVALQVRPDPRKDIPMEDRRAKAAFLDDVEAQSARLAEAADRLREAREAIGRLEEMLGEREDEQAKRLRDQGKSLKKEIQQLTDSVLGERVQGIRRDPDMALTRLFMLTFTARSSWEAPTEAQRLALRHAREKVDGTLKPVEDFFAGAWKDYAESAESAEVQPIPHRP